MKSKKDVLQFSREHLFSNEERLLYIIKEKKSFLVYFDWEAPFDCLSNESLGELFRAMVKYAKSETEPKFTDPTLSIIFSFIKTAVDRDKLAYEERCKKNAENAKKGSRNKEDCANKAEAAPYSFDRLLKTVTPKE